MKNHEIFKTNPNLREVHMTSDGQAFYNDSDAKMHAKTLDKKGVELVLNSKFLVDIEVDEVEELLGSDEPKLEDLTNPQLVAFAKENFNLSLKVNTKKTVLIEAIEAEIAKEKEANASASLDIIDEKNVDQLKTSTGTGEENKAIEGNVDGSANELVGADVNKTDKDQA